MILITRWPISERHMPITPIKHRLRPHIHQAPKCKQAAEKNEYKKMLKTNETKISEKQDSSSSAVHSTPVTAGKVNANANMFVSSTSAAQSSKRNYLVT